jgi:hypothetical protein
MLSGNNRQRIFLQVFLIGVRNFTIFLPKFIPGNLLYHQLTVRRL